MNARSDEDARQLAANIAYLIAAHRKKLADNHRPDVPGLRTIEDLFRAWGKAPARGSVAPQFTSVPVLAMNLEETAAALGLRLRTVEKLVADGELPSLLVGGSRRVRMRALEDYLRRKEAESTRVTADRRASPQILGITAEDGHRQSHAHREPTAPGDQRSA